MRPRVRWAVGWLLLVSVLPALSQIDPERRRLLHLGYNLPLEGSGPIAAYGFVYLNQPHFLRTNLTLRAAIAPIYLDTELAFGQLLGERTDLALGLAGGGYAYTYSEVRDGKYLRDESFIGHGAEISSSIYHLFNPGRLIPLNGVLRGSLRRLFYDEDSETDDAFRLPQDYFSFDLRAGLRWAGQEPTLTAPLGMEVSVWYEGEFRTHSGRYGFGGDREVESISHLFWTRALLRYTFESFRQSLEGSLTAGTSINADRFSAYRLGGVLPFAAEFPLNLPGYYFQELSASQFALLNAQYAFPLEPRGNFQGTLYAGTGWVDYLDGIEQPGNWHSGAGAGITYRSPKGAWFVSLIYAHGFDARRDHGRGANQVGLIFQYDFEATAKWINPAISPYRSRGAERIFRR